MLFKHLYCLFSEKRQQLGLFCIHLFNVPKNPTFPEILAKHVLIRSKYSRMEQVKFVEDSL